MYTKELGYKFINFSIHMNIRWDVLKFCATQTSSALKRTMIIPRIDRNLNLTPFH